MLTQEHLDRLIRDKGRVLSADGSVIGSVGKLYTSDETNEPTWLTVNGGLFQRSVSFVALESAVAVGNDIRLPYSKELVKAAPVPPDDGHLSAEQERQLYLHYGISPDDSARNGGVASRKAKKAAGRKGTGHDRVLTTGTTGFINKKVRRGRKTAGSRTAAASTPDTADTADTAGTPDIELHSREDTAIHSAGVPGAGVGAAGVNSSDAGQVVIRSEEQLRAGVEARAHTRVRVHKYVITENVTRTVTLRREELRVEHLPAAAGDADKPTDGVVLDAAAPDDEGFVIILHQERPVISMEAVPVKRVRLRKDVISRMETVSGEVRREVVDTDAPGLPPGTGQEDGNGTDAGGTVQRVGDE